MSSVTVFKRIACWGLVNPEVANFLLGQGKIQKGIAYGFQVWG